MWCISPPCKNNFCSKLLPLTDMSNISVSLRRVVVVTLWLIMKSYFYWTASALTLKKCNIVVLHSPICCGVSHSLWPPLRSHRHNQIETLKNKYIAFRINSPRCFPNYLRWCCASEGTAEGAEVGAGEKSDEISPSLRLNVMKIQREIVYSRSLWRWSVPWGAPI